MELTSFAIMRRRLRQATLLTLCVLAMMMSRPPQALADPDSGATFGADLAFLRQHTPVVVIGEPGGAQLAVAPAWQGRVMTSSAQGESGRSLGWINRKLIVSGAVLAHFNPFGGEDRLWLGPEGGQYSIYFAPGAPFDLEHWFVPKAFDTLGFQPTEQAKDHATFAAAFELMNRAGTHFKVRIQRRVQLLEAEKTWQMLSVTPMRGISLVAFETRNTLTNAGETPWKKASGLLSVWILGMFNPSPEAVIAIPLRSSAQSDPGQGVTTDYFGSIPADRLQVTDKALLLRADGQFRSKVGIGPGRSLAKLGAYDALHHVLTIVQFEQPAGVTDYVNSLWREQTDPFGGDAVNAYNDGPPAPGKPSMGPFYELESSSPAAALAPGESLTHVHRTVHILGSQEQLDRVARTVLGLSLAEIRPGVGKQSAAAH